MNTALRTNIKLLISTLRTASMNIADDAVRNVEKTQVLKKQETERPKGDEQ